MRTGAARTLYCVRTSRRLVPTAFVLRVRVPFTSGFQTKTVAQLTQQVLLGQVSSAFLGALSALSGNFHSQTCERPGVACRGVAVQHSRGHGNDGFIKGSTRQRSSSVRRRNRTIGASLG